MVGAYHNPCIVFGDLEPHFSKIGWKLISQIKKGHNMLLDIIVLKRNMEHLKSFQSKDSL